MPVALSNLSLEECQRLQGIAFDIDDTLTRDGRLEAIGYDALWKLHQHKLRLVAVTGRPWGVAHVIAQHWPIDAAVAENGACWIARSGHTLLEGTLSSNNAHTQRKLEQLQHDIKTQLPQVSVAHDHPLRRYDLAFDIGEYIKLPEKDIQRLKDIIEAHGAISVRSTVHLHAQFGNWDKAQGVCHVAKEIFHIDMNAEKSRWLFIGDSSNDAAAFDFFPLSVGVANIEPFLPTLPTPPRYITMADRGLGFAECAHTLLELRKHAG